MNLIISRLAPTPSGYLHVGNGVNFVLTYLYTKFYNGVLYLRIDDIDTTRLKLEYIDNIFASLHYLEIDWDKGATNTSDYIKKFSYEKRSHVYKNEIKQLSPFLYPCKCSRKQISTISKNGIYPQTCLNKSLEYNSLEHNLRLHVEPNATIRVDGIDIDIEKTIGDFVLWRKGDLPSYNFASLIDDKNLKTTLIVRGSDLLLPTATQLYLAKVLNIKNFLETKFIHHGLCLDENGKKLSKSTNAKPLLDEKSKNYIYKKVANILNLPSGAEDNIHTLKEAFLKN